MGSLCPPIRGASFVFNDMVGRCSAFEGFVGGLVYFRTMPRAQAYQQGAAAQGRRPRGFRFLAHMAHLGNLYLSNNKFYAKIETWEEGTKFKMFGPRREDKQQATQDLNDIRAAASEGSTRLDGLRAMMLAAKRLQADAKAAIRGGTPAVDSDCFAARIQYVEDTLQKSIAGPPRRTERRANADLAKLRQAAQGQATITEGFAVMRAKCRELHQEAEFEANVAMGLAQYGFVREAHKVVDSDPESEPDASAPPPAQGAEGSDWLYEADFKDPAVVQK